MQKLNVLVVGQCPPPVHGQAIMIQALLRAPLRDVRLYHVPMVFSQRIEQVGRFEVGKVFQLFVLVCRIVWARLRHATTVLYYPPAGPNRLPMYRDWVVLLATRWMFRRTILHFHAGGLAELQPRLSRIGRALFRLAYGSPDCAIHLSATGPQDGSRLDAHRTLVIPNGIEDVYPCYGSQRMQRQGGPPCILFVGSLRESKGVMVLLQACRRLQADGLAFRLELMGEFHSPQFEDEVRQFLTANKLQTQVQLLGVCRGETKWNAYARADLFCFPSFYENENLPVVIVEAMQFALPVVATRWRGIPSLITDGETGLLVDTGSPEQTAAGLARLIQDGQLRQVMGKRGRQRYLRDYTLECWAERMEQALLDAESASIPAVTPAAEL